MRKGRKCVTAVALALLLGLGRTASAEALSDGDVPPSTGSRPAPIIAAMALAYSGVALSLFIEDRNKRK